MSGGERELPEGWVIAPLGELGESSLGKMLDKAKWTTGTPLPYLRNLNVRWGHFALDELYEMPFEDHELDRYAVREGDLLVCEGGEPGRCAIWQGSEQTMMFQKALHRVRPSAALDARYIRYELEHAAQTQALDELFTGTTIKHLTGTSLAKFQVCLPPLNEQRRIVAKIEALTERSRRAKEALDAIPPLLDKLRQSILAAAFRGDLTKDWRAANPDVEPASELLKRIREERRRRWEEAELAKMKAKGKTPTDDTWKARYKEPEPVDTTGLPELPEGWAWASALEVCDLVVDCHNKTAPYSSEGIPLIRTSNIRRRTLSLDGVRFVDNETYARWSRRCPPEPGDLLFTREAPMGEAALVPEGMTVCMGQRMVLLRPSHYATGLWLLAAVTAPHVMKWAQSLAVGTGVKHLRVGDVERLPLPLCSVEEQLALAQRIYTALDVVDSVEQQYANTEAAGELLDSAILAKAFRGELVPQDPNDEPASMLLERIRAEQEGASPKKKSRRRSR